MKHGLLVVLAVAVAGCGDTHAMGDASVDDAGIDALGVVDASVDVVGPDGGAGASAGPEA